MTKNLSYYIQRFTHLRRNMNNGPAPHKPILLLSVIRMFEEGLQANNQIYITPYLVASFKSYWKELVFTDHCPTFALPFFHLRSEPFWSLVPKVGYDRWVLSQKSVSSLPSLTNALRFAVIDKELVNILLDSGTRDILKTYLLNSCFPKAKTNYISIDNAYSPYMTILKESPVEYKRKLIELKEEVDENIFHDELFIRGGLFNSEVPKIYNNTCAISGLRLTAINTSFSMIDACHIVPFSESYDDTLQNGIALCPNLHMVFDEGLISISDDYKVLINNNFVEDKNSAFNLYQFEGKQIILPYTQELYPNLANLANHRERFGY